jgi:hypothetical protein
MDAAGAPDDVLRTGPTDRNRRVWRLVAIVLGVLLLVALVGQRADHAARHREFAGLVKASVDAQATAEHADAQVRSTRAYTLPQLESAPAAVRSGLAKLIADTAAQGVTELRSSRSAISSTSVLPWHGSIRTAKRAELAYVDTWLNYLQDVAASGDIAARPSQALDADESTARAALAAAG